MTTLNPLRTYLIRLLLTLVAFTPTLAAALECRISPLETYILKSHAKIKANEMVLLADEGTLTPTEGNLKGNVLIQDKGGNFYSESIFLDRVNNIIFSKNDPVYYGSHQVAVQGEQFKHFLDEEITDLISGSYYLSGEQPAQGRANTLHHEAQKETTTLTRATYSACPVDNEIWTIESNDLEIRHDEGRAYAKNATFQLGGYSVLYTPYISFPIDRERHSGLLTPIIRVGRSDGFILRVPYYFNLAPNYDATLGVGIMTKRGPIFDGEFRYLNTWQEASLGLEYVPDDRQYGHKRWSYLFDQQLTFNPYLTGNILLQKVSDDSYVKDFDDTVGLLSKTNLERHASLIYSDGTSSLSFRLQDFQIIDKEAIKQKPYSRLPQIAFTTLQTKGLLEYGVEAEFVRFTTHLGYYDASRADTRPKIGNRFDIKPFLRLNFENSWGFFRPGIAYRYTHYWIKDHNPHYVGLKNFHRSLPIYSVDSGVFLERNLQLENLFGGGDYIQTLEPRLFYLRVPFRSQSHIPLFDTSLFTPSYSTLFKTSVFTGADRQNDANQLTTALTTRFINAKTGVEKLRLSAGQIHYFSKPRIRRGDDLTREEAKRQYSEWFIEGDFEIIPKLYSNLTWQWVPKKRRTNKTTFDLRYQPEAQKILNLSYRYSHNDSRPNNTINQIDLSSFWEINSKWSLIGRYNHSLNNGRMIDTMAGVQYNNCCVRIQALTRIYRDHPLDRDKQWRLYLMFDLKNMGSFGQSTDILLEEQISGYHYRNL